MQKNIKSFFIAIISSLIISFNAFALDLDTAKRQGKVGEMPNGYIGATHNSPSPEISNLINTINTLRKQEYQKISQQNGQPIFVIEQLAANKLIQKLEPGLYYLDDNGYWQVK